MTELLDRDEIAMDLDDGIDSNRRQIFATKSFRESEFIAAVSDWVNNEGGSGSG